MGTGAAGKENGKGKDTGIRKPYLKLKKRRKWEKYEKDYEMTWRKRDGRRNWEAENRRKKRRKRGIYEKDYEMNREKKRVGQVLGHLN